MKKEKIGLVLEGGGMRGIYSVGVLDYMQDHGINVDYVIGVSAGACNGISYVSGQQGRNYRVNTNYLGDKRYASTSNFFRERSIFGMDFIFDKIPNELDPFDYAAFAASPVEFVVGVTDVLTGKPKYFNKQTMHEVNTILKASSSIPVFSPPVSFEGGEYLDGGTSDPIPVRKAMEDGCDKVIVILTREREYVKPPESFRMIYSKLFRNNPAMVDLLNNRHHIYNDTLAYVRELEQAGKAIVVAPSTPVNIGRFEKSKNKLDALHQMGLKDAEKVLGAQLASVQASSN